MGKDSAKPTMIFWVGRMHPTSWTENERRTFEALGQKFGNLFLPFQPMLLNGNVLRSWLESTTGFEASKWLEEGLAFLLELLLFAAGTKDGAIVLTDLKGNSLFGVAKGEEGKKWLEMRHRPMTLRQSFAIKYFSESQWTGIIVVKVSDQMRLKLFIL
jgi:hypothetical protein